MKIEVFAKGVEGENDGWMRLGFTECRTEIKGEALMGCGAEMFEERTVPLEISAEHLRQCEDVVPVGDCSKDAGDEELGAGLDVFVSEPPTGSPLIGLENIQLTPHLGASTEEAQEKAGISVARSVRLALAGDLVPDAVNVAGGVIDASVKPGIALAEKLGQIVAGLAQGSIVSVEFEARGEIAAHDVTVLKLAALKGLFQTMVTEQVSYVNAPLMAESRGIEVRLVQDTVSDEYRNVTTVKAVLSDGSVVSVGGTVIGPKHHQKVVSINGYDVELSMAENLVVMVYQDRPGIVAIYGKAFAEANINIAAMTIARQQKGGKALAVITVDSPVDAEVLEGVRKEIDADVMRAISITDQC